MKKREVRQRMIDRGPFISISEAAELLECTVKDVQRLIREGEIQSKKVTRVSIIPRESITEYLQRKNSRNRTSSSTE
jgi:excisionase family DNA binding protein